LDINQKHTFIELNDDTARLINDRANHLYRKLAILDISDTDIDEFGKHYFNSHHGGNRLFFSVQSSADIIYHSVKKSNKEISELVFIDYGAGLGTLFLLAGTIGFKQVYFNDYFPQWAVYAGMICKKLDVHITGFITGDIDTVIDYNKANNIHFDILASRNVVEHIYNLRDFYTKLYQSGVTGICYATTTANYHNIAMRLKHYRHHYQVEKTAYKKQRADHIRELIPAVNDTDLKQLIKLTRGRAFADFTQALDLYFKNQPIPAVEFLRTNTCDCKTGVWAENLITRKDYFDIIQNAGFTAEYTAGFWDTNYKYAVVNLLTGSLNRVIRIFGTKGYWFAPFVKIVACTQDSLSKK
jgi:2-polyprenyl-3-methyl-5-hydroxy-6-metoxy-1,4-benzoquinol methylase